MKPLFLFLASLAVLLTACDRGGSPPPREALLSGADRQVGTSSRLPSPPANQPHDSTHDSTIVPSDDTRGARIGSVVSARGGQKAQKEKEERAEMEARRNRQRQQEAQDVAPPGGEAIPQPAQ